MDRSEALPYIPVVRTINNIKIAVTGSDLEGFNKNEGEIQQAKENIIIDVALATVGGAVLSETGIASSAMNAINNTVTKYRSLQAQQLIL
ncbi:MAG TPA: hypothetical protein GXX36_03735 [Clostridiaceae bacterium]|nr:hypothetical protein [Clostridiaceae bacterium]